MSIYKIKTCQESDVPLLISFIKKYWQEDHIFVKSRELFNFQHYNSNKDEYTFMLGVNSVTHEIDGIMGIIPVSQYDQELEEYNDTWGGIWKVRSDVVNPEIGTLGLLLFEKFAKYRTHGSLGMNKVSTKYHAIMKYHVCVLNQYYFLNRDVNKFRIAKIPANHKASNTISITPSMGIDLIKDIHQVAGDSISCAYSPKKSLTYLRNRFQKHPIYKYSFYGVYDAKKRMHCIFVVRKIKQNETHVLRIVDVFGDLKDLGNLAYEFQRLLNIEQAEYLDLMNYGLNPEIFKQIGFNRLDTNSDIVIPNYFEPFLRSNVEIHCAYRGNDNYVMFKADADQDRPSIVE